jgi:hypothetical protein
MAASTKQKIAEAARKRFKTKEIKIADEVFVVVSEISPAAETALLDRLYEKGADGKFLVIDKDGNPSADGKGWFKKKEGISIIREWLLATMSPVEAVDDIMNPENPDSLREEIYEEVKAINGYPTSATIAKNS